MNVGHAAVALSAVKAAPKLNVGWLIFAALLADLLLGIFAFWGLEHASVPQGYASKHYLLFTFPYSHGLFPLLIWSAFLGFVVSRLWGPDRLRIFVVVGVVVLSHFILDALVHVAGLPLAGESSPKLGLALWNHMTLELCLESLMAFAGVVIYLRASGAAAGAGSRWGIPIFMIMLTAVTWTQLLGTKPPQPNQLITGWITAPVLATIVYVLDRKRAGAVTNQAAECGRSIAVANSR